ncbi:unnamed protein product [Didymodactylos carnosus]|uniref:Protein SHQ1 homolog n=1 Tax=Didymodactylos carnosus TaxID=1234261 RepID=A0A813UNT6_9BILA|nr:unnamed protein product [Didymodactylos carnosus]CAF0925418.1 unnamed protein product [Didymodactylos carnosus]CAF3617189.1 unnamed protein product [Didymodactylos carnosus]CAF3702532.1 unnamed protein product [Didymodactylos carnosus]
MMLTPRFELSQTNDCLQIMICCPYAHLTDVECDIISDNEFYFYLKPYYLHLYLPGKVKDEQNYTYDVENSTFTFLYKKMVMGEYFNDLDMLTNLLYKDKKITNKIAKVETVESVQEDEEEDDEPMWSLLEEKLDSVEESSSIQLVPNHYGFNLSYSEIFSKFDPEYLLIFDNKIPEILSQNDIRLKRYEMEQKDFNPDHYLFDLFDEENQATIQDLIDYKPQYDKHFTEQDKDDLKNLPHKKLLIETNNNISLYLGLVDLLFSYSYNKRITMGENCIESPWNLQKLSSQLSWFDSIFNDLNDCLLSCLRRSLIYPLYRSFDLSLKCLCDVSYILKMGKKLILKCLLEIRRLFLDEERRYLLNDLFIDDYCLWLQSSQCHQKWLISLGETIENIQYKKKQMNLNLDKLEENQDETDELCWKIKLVDISDEDDEEE